MCMCMCMCVCMCMCMCVYVYSFECRHLVLLCLRRKFFLAKQFLVNNYFLFWLKFFYFFFSEIFLFNILWSKNAFWLKIFVWRNSYFENFFENLLLEFIFWGEHFLFESILLYHFLGKRLGEEIILENLLVSLHLGTLLFRNLHGCPFCCDRCKFSTRIVCLHSLVLFLENLQCAATSCNSPVLHSHSLDMFQLSLYFIA